ncbi:HAMP domain-containing sensor histidine kinase [Brachybacterium phenoliresistens]|uniref:sensor histidine kinase n=1 Tax=Brachybacterium phenoliresistens TaxID=396014 RepID=UPI0031D46BDE
MDAVLGAGLLGLLIGAAAGLLLGRARRPAAAAPPPAVAADRAVVRMLSHEIRTPLALVRGAGELLAEESPGPLNRRQRSFVATIVDNTTLVIGMAEGFLLEARWDAGTPALDCTAVDVRALARETVLELRRIRRRPVELDSRGGPLVLEVDAGMIRQVLWNLLGNAIRHAGPEARVSVRVDETVEGAVIEVADDGAGMDEQARDALFAPGGSGHPEGTGIGMDVITRIVDAHGGRIVVDTLSRRGTRIMVVLPWPAPGGEEG